MITDIFERYGEVTKEIVVSIKEDKDSDGLMEKRDSILKELQNSNYTSEEKLLLYKSKGLDVLDKELENLVKDEMLKVKNHIKATQSRKLAHTTYNSNMVNNNMFTKKV